MSVLYNNPKPPGSIRRPFNCNVCGEYIFKISKAFKYGVVVYICKCGAITKIFNRIIKDGDGNYTASVRKGSDYLCPLCGRVLLSVNADTLMNVSFAAKCNCGCVCKGSKDWESSKRFNDADMLHYQNIERTMK